MTAPVQVLVVGLAPPPYDGSVLQELARLRAAGVVRLIDLLVVRRLQDGTLETVDPPVWAPPELGRLTAALLGEQEIPDAPLPDDVSQRAAWSLVDAVPVGGLAAVALLEHLWAAPLVDAITASGSTPLDETWLTEEDRARLRALEH